MSLRIHYRSGTDELTERVISDVVVEPPNTVHALCHLRGEERTFVLSRIEEAVDLSTGEPIPDIWLYFGLPTLKPAPPSIPVFSQQPCPMSTEQAQQQRKTDKQALFQRFKLVVIAETYQAKLYQLFDNLCFRCNSPESLELDHHIPQYLSGRLVPGNIVLLCASCNMAKGKRHPKSFYTAEELARLQEVLQKELHLFDFRFDTARWSHHPRQYLLSLGIKEQDIQYTLHDREHPFFVSGNTELDY